MKSIKLKLTVYFSILILLALTTIGVFAIKRGSEIITKEAEKALALLATEGVKVTESRIETQMKILEMIALIEDI